VDLGVLISGCIFFFGFRYGGYVPDDEERGGSGVDGRDEARVGDEVDRAGCHGRSVGYIWSHHRRDLVCGYSHLSFGLSWALLASLLVWTLASLVTVV
jgi:hypothetical protein